MRVLLNEEASVATRVGGKGGCGYTALRAAVQGGHLAVTKMLVKAGSDVEKRPVLMAPRRFTWLRVGIIRGS